VLFSNSGQLLLSFTNVSDHCDTWQLKVNISKTNIFPYTKLHNFNLYTVSYLARYHFFYFVYKYMYKSFSYPIVNTSILGLKVLGSLGFDIIFERVNNILILHDKVKII